MQHGLHNPAGKTGPDNLLAGLAEFGSVAEFRAAAPLPKRTEELIDGAVTRVGRQRLVVVQDILAEGLIYPLPNWISVPTIYWEKMAEAGHAQRTMVPKARGERQVQDRGGDTIPIYITWDDFSFNIRELSAAQRVGSPLDTTSTEMATRNVNVGIEDALINGAGLTVGGFGTPGLSVTTNTSTFVSNEAWTAAGHSGQDILQDVLDMIDVLKADNFFGPYNLYIPTTYGTKLNQNFGDGTTTFEQTIRARLEAVMAGGRGLRVREADLLPADTVYLVQMTSDVLDIVNGQSPAAVSWSDGPGWMRNFVVMACMVPRIKQNYDGNYGICKGTPS